MDKMGKTRNLGNYQRLTDIVSVTSESVHLGGGGTMSFGTSIKGQFTVKVYIDDSESDAGI
jgi:hypothetical protein